MRVHSRNASSHRERSEPLLGNNILAGDDFKLRPEGSDSRPKFLLLADAYIGFEFKDEVLSDVQDLKMLHGNFRFREGSVGGGIVASRFCAVTRKTIWRVFKLNKSSNQPTTTRSTRINRQAKMEVA